MKNLQFYMYWCRESKRWVYTERDRGLRRWSKYNKLKSYSEVVFCMNDFSLFYLDHSFAKAAVAVVFYINKPL